MAIQNRFGSRNPLLRHVRRHANTTTLFRQPNDAQPSPGAVYTAWPMGVSPAAPAADEAVRDAAIAQAERVSAAPPIQSTAVARPTAVSSSPPSPPAPAAPVQRTAVPQPDPAPSAPPAKDDDWPEWGRLESIARRHQVRRVAEAAGQKAPAALPPQSAPADTVSHAVAAAESAADPAEPAPDRLPLESVWPVRREPASAPAASSAPPLPSGPVLADQEEALVRAKLEDVHAGRASGSSIELHLPRRPRPDRPPQSQPPPAGRPSLQRVVDPSPSDASSSEATPSLIETSIGPLPADMWEILGQEPPAPPPSAPVSEVQGAIAAAESAPVSAAATAVPASPPSASSPLQTAVQRTADAPEPAQPAKLPVDDVEIDGVPATGTTAKSETAVSPLPSPAQTLEPGLQRAIAAAEAPSGEPAATATIVPSASSAKTAPVEQVQRARDVGESPRLENKAGIQTAVRPEPPSPAAAVADVQRVIAADEAPRETGVSAPSEPPETRPDQTAVADQTIAPPKVEVIQRAFAAAEAPPAKERVAVDETAVPPVESPTAPPAPPDVEVMQRALAAAEAPPAKERVAVGETAVPPVESLTAPLTPPNVEVMQRALAAAEAPSAKERVAVDETAAPPVESPTAPLKTSRTLDDETAVGVPSLSAESVQRAIAAAEAPPPDVADEGVTPSASPAVEASPAAQQAIAVVETPPAGIEKRGAPPAAPTDSPQTGAEKSLPGIQAQAMGPETAVTAVPASPDAGRVRRAIAAAETAPARPTASPPIIQLKSGAHEVAPPTAVSAPKSAPPAVVAEMDTQPALPLPDKRLSAPPAIASEPPTPDAIQRAITAVESRPVDSRPAPTLRVPARLANLPESSLSSGGYTAVPPTLAQSQPAAALRPTLAWPSQTGTAAVALLQGERVQRAMAVAEAPSELPRPGLGLSAPVWQRPLAVAGQTERAGQASTVTSVAQAVQAAAQTAPLPAGAAAVEVQRQAAERPLPEISPAASDRVQPQVIQRDSTDEDTATANPSAKAVLPEPETEEETAVDVDELARQVYHQLRRRLTIERERERGRL